jgi:hypothetical protein
MKKFHFAIYLDNKAKGALLQTLKYYQQKVYTEDVLIIYKRKLRIMFNYWNVLRKTKIPFISFFKYSTLPNLDDTIMLYPFNALSNCRMVTNRKTKHIFVTHGESHKVTSTKPIVRIYDHIIVAGNAGVDRFLEEKIFTPYDIENHKVIKMGDTFIGDSLYRYSHTAKTLLYAPTWEGGLKEECYSSITKELHSFKLLQEYAKGHQYNTIIIQPHPNTGYINPRYLYYLYQGICYLEEQGFTIKIRTWTTSFFHQFLFRNFTLIPMKESVDVGCAFCDISAMEVQLLNRNIPTFVFFFDMPLSMPKNTLLQQYYQNVGIYHFQSNFTIDTTLQQKVKAYYISYEEGLETLPYDKRLEWLAHYIQKYT